jgi:hypothetical protein
LLKTLLDSSVITQLLSTKAGSIPRASLLLLRRSHMAALSEDQRAVCNEKRTNQQQFTHHSSLQLVSLQFEAPPKRLRLARARNNSQTSANVPAKDETRSNLYPFEVAQDWILSASPECGGLYWTSE